VLVEVIGDFRGLRNSLRSLLARLMRSRSGGSNWVRGAIRPFLTADTTPRSAPAVAAGRRSGGRAAGVETSPTHSGLANDGRFVARPRLTSARFPSSSPDSASRRGTKAARLTPLAAPMLRRRSERLFRVHQKTRSTTPSVIRRRSPMVLLAANGPRFPAPSADQPARGSRAGQQVVESANPTWPRCPRRAGNYDSFRLEQRVNARRRRLVRPVTISLFLRRSFD